MKIGSEKEVKKNENQFLFAHFRKGLNTLGKGSLPSSLSFGKLQMYPRLSVTKII